MKFNGRNKWKIRAPKSTSENIEHDLKLSGMINLAETKIVLQDKNQWQNISKISFFGVFRK